MFGQSRRQYPRLHRLVAPHAPRKTTARCRTAAVHRVAWCRAGIAAIRVGGLPVAVGGLGAVDVCVLAARRGWDVVEGVSVEAGSAGVFPTNSRNGDGA